MKNERYASLDAVKIFFTVIFLFHHYQQVLGIRFDSGFDFCYGPYPITRIVELFFLLSGFFMLKWSRRITEGGEDSRFKSFFGSRLLRFLPMMILTAVCYEAVCVAAGVLFPGRTNFCFVDVDALLEAVLGVNCGWCFNNIYWVNSPTWYLSVLLLCYIVFWLVTDVCGKRKLPPAGGYVLILLLSCGILSFGIELPFLNEYSARGFRGFFLGLLLAEAMDRYEVHSPLYILLSLVFCALAAANRLGRDVALTFLFWPGLVILFTWEPVKKLFSAKFWSVLGNIQFHVYVWHMTGLMLCQLLRCTVPVRLESRTAMLIFAAVMELWGAFSYFVLDRPVRELLLRLLPREKAKGAAI